MTIDEWACPNRGKRWRVSGGVLTAADVLAVYDRLHGPTTLGDAVLALTLHPDVVNMARFGLGLETAEKLAAKALRILVANGVIGRPRRVLVWTR